MTRVVTQAVTVTAEQRRQLDALGYFITDALFDEDTLGPLRAEFHRLWQNLIAHEERVGQGKGIGQARTRPFMARLHEQSAACDAFLRHSAFLELSRQLLGPHADCTWNQAILKPPGGGDNSFAWHQDQWYAVNGDYAEGCDPNVMLGNESAFTVWVAVTRTTVENGTLWLLPGRHKEGLLPHVWSAERHEWQGRYDTGAKIPAVMEAGQVLVFRRYVPHASGANTSAEIRMAYQVGYSVPGLKRVPSPDLFPVMRDGVALPTIAAR